MTCACENHSLDPIDLSLLDEVLLTYKDHRAIQYRCYKRRRSSTATCPVRP